ncbi:hypothetical protein WA158_003330 [Blastocystis sp. Blastoise]
MRCLEKADCHQGGGSSTQVNTSMDVVDGDGPYLYGLEDSSVSLVSSIDDGVRLSSGPEGSSVVVDSVAGAIDDDVNSTNGLEGSYVVNESSTDGCHPSEAKGSIVQLVPGYSSIHSLKDDTIYLYLSLVIIICFGIVLGLPFFGCI